MTLVDLRDPRSRFRPATAAGSRSTRERDQALLPRRRAPLDGGRQAQGHPELRRGMRDMIVESLNEATGYLVDSLTDTTSGPS